MTTADPPAEPDQRLLPLAAFASRVPPAKGTQTDPATLVRWAKDGCRSPGGVRVRLKATRVGGRWMLTEVAWAAFLAELTAGHIAEPNELAATGHARDGCDLPHCVNVGR